MPYIHGVAGGEVGETLMPELDMTLLTASIREEFEKRIAVKTGWGKNQIMIEFDKAMIVALNKELVRIGGA